MGDMGDFYKDMRTQTRAIRWTFGIECPTCLAERPNGNSTVMLPGQRCRVCGNVDRRARLTDAEQIAAYDAYILKFPREAPKAEKPPASKQKTICCDACAMKFGSPGALGHHQRATGHLPTAEEAEAH